MKKSLAFCSAILAISIPLNTIAHAQAGNPYLPKRHPIVLDSGGVDPSLLKRLRSLDHRVKQAALLEAKRVVEEGKCAGLVGKPLDEFLDAVMTSELAPGQYSGEIGGGISMAQREVMVALTKYRHDEANAFVQSLLRQAGNQQNEWTNPRIAIAVLAETTDERSLQPVLAQAVEDARNNIKGTPSHEVLRLIGWKIVPAVLNYFYKERDPFETKVIASILKDAVGKKAANAILDREIEKRKVRQLLRLNEIAPDFMVFLGTVDLYRLARDEKGLVELRRSLNEDSIDPVGP